MMVMVANQVGMDIAHLAHVHPGQIGHLYSPGKGRVAGGPWSWMPYALDNGAFVAWKKSQGWDESGWRALLVWAALSGVRPLWTLVPDVVKSRDGTLEAWHRYAPVARAMGATQLAFAAQDGMTFNDVPQDAAVIFLGGDDEWKDAAIGPWCARFPGRVHVGRVNGWTRLIACHRAGAISVDGTGWYHKANNASGGQWAVLLKYLRETAYPCPA